jgi:putative intracellular protease/amidase
MTAIGHKRTFSIGSFKRALRMLAFDPDGHSIHQSVFTVGLLLFPKLTQLDLIGPAEVFGRLPGVKLHLVWKDLEPIASDRGLRILPSTTFDACPNLDLICVVYRVGRARSR